MIVHWRQWLEANDIPPERNMLLRSLAKAVQNNAHKSPFFARIVADHNEFTNFLMSAGNVIRAMPPEQREMIASGPQGIGILLNRMIQDYTKRTGNRPDAQNTDDQQVQHKQAATKLVNLATKLAQRLGKEPKPYVDFLIGMMKKNPQKVGEWASRINSEEDMLQNFNRWKGL